MLRVLPLARVKALPRAPHCVRALLDLHGDTLPVIDVSDLADTA